MALQVWLPLAGTLENKGLSNYAVNMFRGSEVYSDNGKIGRCFNCNGVNTIKVLNIIPDFLNYTGYSLCAWFCVDGNNTTHTGSAVVSAGNWNNQLINLAVSDWSTDHYTRLRVSGTSWNQLYSYNFNKNTWYHVVVCSDGSKTYAYVNGELIGDTAPGFLPTSIEGNDLCIGGATYYAGMQFYGRVNDVRIYDHCLSDKEIKEISKALVLHYKLDNLKYVQENLMPNFLEMQLGSANPSTGTWRLAGSTSMTKSRVSISDSPYGPCYGFQNSGIQTPNDGSCYGIDSFPLEANTDYLISMYARIVEGTEGYAGYNIYQCTHNYGSWTKVDKNYYVTPLPADGSWQRCWITIHTNSNSSRNIYIGITTGETSVTTQMCCVQIHKLFISDEIAGDCSGYRNDGTLNGSFKGNVDTPRYSSSALFDGTNNSILVPYNSICPDNIFTLNLWFKKDALGSKNYETLFGGPSGFEMDTRANTATTLSLYMASVRGGNLFSPLPFGEWVMITMTRDGANEKYYVNGELKKTIEAKSMPNGNYYIGSWKSATQQNYYGLISDFRLYNTALSADDILELYHTSASVDHDGSVYAREIVEA